ncbi:MAG: NfeD family protein, partial [Candidatus Hydrogenedentota bacterium]
ADVIVVCPITGIIEPGVLVLIERAIAEATELNAKAIIFRVDTPGGRVDTAVEIAKVIGEAPCRTIAYIEGMGAISAGALISFACDDLIMTASSNIGAAAPVYQTSEGMEPAGEKSVSFMRAKMRALAEAKNHNPDIAQAMVDKDIELRGYTDELGDYIVYAWDSDGSEDSRRQSPEISTIQKVIDTVTENLPINVTVTPKEETESEVVDEVEEVDVGTVVYKDGSELVLASGKLLTLTPSEAIRYGVIDTTVDSVDETVTHFMLGGGTYHIVEPNWAELTFRFLTSPTIAGLLLMLGMGGLYLEVRTPGFGLPGIVGITCLALLFGSHFVLGLADTIDIFLVIAGILLIIAEIFIIPGFGIAGIAGMLCLVVGVYLSFVDFTIPQYSWDFARLNDVAYSFAVFVISGFAFVLATWKLMPLVPFYGSMILSDTMAADAGYVGQDLEKAKAVLGTTGIALTPLRPVGKGHFADEKYNIVTRGDFIEKGAKVEIIESDGNRYVVRPVKEEA